MFAEHLIRAHPRAGTFPSAARSRTVNIVGARAPSKAQCADYEGALQNTFSTTVTIGLDLRITGDLVFRPINNGTIGRVPSDWRMSRPCQSRDGQQPAVSR